jgi:hypothetical protein
LILALGVIAFLLIYYALDWFIHYQAAKDYQRIMKQAEQQTEELMKNLDVR